MREDAQRILRDIGRRIAEVRVGRGWSQPKFAERHDISVIYLQSLERGDRSLTIPQLVDIARSLGVPYLTLLEPPHGTPTSMRAGRQHGTQRRRTSG